MELIYEKRGYLLEDFRLFHLREPQGTGVDYHYHEFFKLLMVLSGRGSYAVEGRRYQLRAGDIVLLPSHTVHRPEFESGQPYERIILYISPAFLERESAGDCLLSQVFSSSGKPVLRLPEHRWNRLLSLAEELEQELMGDRYGRVIAGNGLLLRLLVELGRSQQKEDAQWQTPVTPRSTAMEALLRYLEENLTRELTVDELSEHFYLSKYHLMRRFRRETGTTIHTYITERRLFLARDLMAQGLSSTEACFQAGFGSYSSFSRAYGRFFRTTPTGRPTHANDQEDVFE